MQFSIIPRIPSPFWGVVLTFCREYSQHILSLVEYFLITYFSVGLKNNQKIISRIKFLPVKEFLIMDDRRRSKLITNRKKIWFVRNSSLIGFWIYLESRELQLIIFEPTFCSTNKIPFSSQIGQMNQLPTKQRKFRKHQNYILAFGIQNGRLQSGFLLAVWIARVLIISRPVIPKVGRKPQPRAAVEKFKRILGKSRVIARVLVSQ